jgi:hypothetical protein
LNTSFVQQDSPTTAAALANAKTLPIAVGRKLPVFSSAVYQ